MPQTLKTYHLYDPAFVKHNLAGDGDIVTLECRTTPATKIALQKLKQFLGGNAVRNSEANLTRFVLPEFTINEEGKAELISLTISGIGTGPIHAAKKLNDQLKRNTDGITAKSEQDLRNPSATEMTFSQAQTHAILAQLPAIGKIPGK